MIKEKIFAELYRENIGLVIFYARKSFDLDKSTAEDMAQTAFLKAHDNFESLQDLAKFRPWILAITRNTILNEIQRKKRLTSLGDEQNQPENDDLSKENFKNERELILIREFLKELPGGGDHDIFRAFYLEGLNTTQIAEKFMTPVSTITTKLSRMRQRIKSELIAKINQFRENYYE